MIDKKELNKIIDRATPKKPKKIRNNVQSTTSFYCPSCMKNDRYKRVYVGQKYCDECGQTILWSTTVL